MMERRRALTLPFTVDKDNLVSWTAFAGCKLRHSSLRHKNGSMTFDQNRAAMITMEMNRRRPLLVLRDVLKTEAGQAYIDRTKKSPTMSSRGPSTRRESVRSKEVPLTYSDTKTRNNRSNSETPKRNQKTTPASTPRSKPRKGQQKTEEEEDKEDSKDIEEVVLGKDNGEDDKFAEVVDCGLSVSWEPTENTAGCEDFSPPSIKDRWTDPEKDVQQNLKRKRKDSQSQCNGTSSPKRHRESVLRLTGEDGRNGTPVTPTVGQEETGEDVDLENLDRCIVQFTVGGDDQTSPAEPSHPYAGRCEGLGDPGSVLSESSQTTTSVSHAGHAGHAVAAGGFLRGSSLSHLLSGLLLHGADLLLSALWRIPGQSQRKHHDSRGKNHHTTDRLQPAVCSGPELGAEGAEEVQRLGEAGAGGERDALQRRGRGRAVS